MTAGWSWRWPGGIKGDVIIAAGLFATFVVAYLIQLGAHPGFSDGLFPAAAWPMAVVLFGLLIWRRRYPLLIMWATLLGCVAYFPMGEPDGPIFLTIIVTLYTAAERGHTLHAFAGATASIVLTLGGELLSYPNRNVDNVSIFFMIDGLYLAAAAGVVMRNRRNYIHAVEQRARDAEASKEETARARVAEERLRLAREIHDVVGHHLSLINVQAGAALHRLKRDPAQAEDALTAIKSASRQALREIRTTLGILRQTGEEATTAPTPGLALLDDLAGRTRAAGLDVQLTVTGDPPDLPADIDLAAYRIIQESLTNVRRHADASTVVITIGYGDDLTLRIVDDGQGPPARGNGGMGIRGMRDRAEAVGGSLSTGPAPGGGFRVEAGLPLKGQH